MMIYYYIKLIILFPSQIIMLRMKYQQAVGGFDGAGFGNYLLPYAGGAVLAIGLTAAAFYALISGTI